MAGGNSVSTHNSLQSAPPFSRNALARLSIDFAPMQLADRLSSTDDGNTDQLIDSVVPLGQDVKGAIATMARLETLGLQKLDIAIPRCIVLGQQSTGKSSVIEAISGIRTPRDTGTCTRCPLFITMQPSDDPAAQWSAHVYLQQDYDLDTQPRPPPDRQPYPGWTPAQSSRRIPFAETKSSAELERLIKCAQSANLSPLVPPQAFLEGPEPPIGAQRCKFSPNLVCIDIIQPDLPPLSFFDLPGIISQAETEEEAHIVPLVENLVAEYVKKTDSLVLVTCDLGTDIANSTAAGFARQHKATDRCIGVLTKPDLLPPGTADETLVKLLEGNSFKLGHGYFVVKNLDKEEINRGLTHRDARVKEREFFASGRWTDTLQEFQSRFGTRNLQQYLSKQLATQILGNLPVIREQVATRLRKANEELDSMPLIPGHSAVRKVSDIVLAFADDVRAELLGEHDGGGWRTTWTALKQDFYAQLLALKPTMSTTGDLDKGLFRKTLPGTSISDSIMVESDEEDGDSSVEGLPETPSKKRKRETATPALSKSKTPVKNTSKLSNATPIRRQMSGRGLSTVDPDPSTSGLAAFQKRYALDELTEKINKGPQSKVPDTVHPKIQEALMVSQISKWKLLVDIFFQKFECALFTTMQQSFNTHFSSWTGSELHHNAWAILDDLLKNNFQEQRNTMAAEALKDELEGPYIFFQDEYAQEKAVTYAKYHAARQRSRLRILIHETEDHLRRELSQNEKDKISKDDRKMAVVTDEPYEAEIKLMAEVSSYYNIAVRRLHSSVCMRVESKFFKQLRTQLRDELESGLRIYDETEGPMIAQRLLSESSQRTKRRQELIAIKAALKEGLDCLDALQGKSRGGSSGNRDLRASSSDKFGSPLATKLAEGMSDVAVLALARH
ncbi:hypothetical protein ACN47E_000760 [Coniothyrium glycines]